MRTFNGFSRTGRSNPEIETTVTPDLPNEPLKPGIARSPARPRLAIRIAQACRVRRVGSSNGRDTCFPIAPVMVYYRSRG